VYHNTDVKDVLYIIYIYQIYVGQGLNI